MKRLACDKELQIVFRSGNAIVSEFAPQTNSVEKDGTGIKAMDGHRCRFAIGIRANISQDVFMEQGRSGCPETVSGIAQRIPQPTWHQEVR